MSKKSLLSYLSSKFTRKEIRDITGIPESTQRRYIREGIPEKAKYKKQIKTLETKRKSFTKFRKKEHIKSALKVTYRPTFQTREFTIESPGDLSRAKDYLAFDIPINLSLEQFRDKTFLRALREDIKALISPNYDWGYIRCFFDRIDLDTGEIVGSSGVTSKVLQLVAIENMLSSFISAVFALQKNAKYNNDIEINSVGFYMFNFKHGEQE